MKHVIYCVQILLFTFILIPNISSDCGTKNLNQSDVYAIDTFVNDGLITECGCDSENVCVRKCCAVNYVVNNNTCVLNNLNQLANLPIFKNGNALKSDSINIRFVPGMVNCFGKGAEYFNQLHPDLNAEDRGSIQSDGRLWIASTNAFYEHPDYCVDYAENFELIYNVCHNNTVPPLTVTDLLTIIGTVISLPFFLITFVVYALLPERNLNAKCLMSHVFAIFLAYFLLCILPLNRGKWTVAGCRAMGMTILCSFMASIFWVNLMAFDIYSTFRGRRTQSPDKKREDLRRFIIYNIYAWGVPLLFISLVFILSNTVTANVWYDPGVRGTQCFINDGVPELLYYYGPLAILIISNIVMFSITASKIRKTQKDTAMLSSRGSKKHGPKDNDRQMFQLYIRLLFAMGINWSIEIIEWAIRWQVENVPPQIWWVSQFCNAAYGVIVFILFVCKRNIWRALKKRYYKARGIELTEMTTTTTMASE